ncbi:Satratoxin biosynthesis SC1 cluster protein [Paramyrothecium foliicola]|nr:Satratoxin biosynthesis SC1 cluster protein [Paramyrothecium foliicola]
MSAVEIESRAWAPGTDFPDPIETNWLHYLGLSVLCILWILSLLVVCIRLWARWTVKQLGVDDYLIVAAMAVNTGWFYTLIMYMKTCYVGIHYWNVQKLTLEQQSTAKLYEWLIILLYHPVLGFVKASVLCFDERLTSVKRPVRYTVRVLQVINAGCMISVFCVTLFQCNPISLNWKPGYRRRCIDNTAFNYAYNCIVIATDVAVLAVPFWAFVGLQMKTRLKVAILCVFALGGIVTIISCVRLALLVNWFDKFYKGLGTKDIYYSFGWAVSPIECNLAIVAASIPALWPLFRNAFPSMFSDLNYSYRVDTQSASALRAAAFRSSAARPMGRSRPHDDADDIYMMDSIRGTGRANCRVTTPTGSQDGIIDSKEGIVRTTDVEINYEETSKVSDDSSNRDEYGRKKVVYGV